MHLTFWTKKLMIYVVVIRGLIVTKCLWVNFEINLIGVATRTLGLFNFPHHNTYTTTVFLLQSVTIIIASLRLPNTSHLTEPPKSPGPKAWNPHLLTHQIFMWVNLHVVSHQGGGANSRFVVSWHTVFAWCCVEGLGATWVEGYWWIHSTPSKLSVTCFCWGGVGVYGGQIKAVGCSWATSNPIERMRSDGATKAHRATLQIQIT